MMLKRFAVNLSGGDRDLTIDFQWCTSRATNEPILEHGERTLSYEALQS